MENYPEGEVREMIDIYESRGMSPEDAKLVIETMAKYKDFFVDVMMQQELELQVSFEPALSHSMTFSELDFLLFLMLCFVRYLMKITCRKVVGKVSSLLCKNVFVPFVGNAGPPSNSNFRFCHVLFFCNIWGNALARICSNSNFIPSAWK